MLWLGRTGNGDEGSCQLHAVTRWTILMAGVIFCDVLPLSWLLKAFSALLGFA